VAGGWWLVAAVLLQRRWRMTLGDGLAGWSGRGGERAAAPVACRGGDNAEMSQEWQRGVSRDGRASDDDAPSAVIRGPVLFSWRLAQAWQCRIRGARELLRCFRVDCRKICCKSLNRPVCLYTGRKLSPRSCITCCCSQGNMRDRDWKLGQLEAILIREIRSLAAPHHQFRTPGLGV
jgi:hypothetical protein